MRPTPLVPPDGGILHGAGQSLEAYHNYRACFPQQQPKFFMSYCGLRRCAAKYWDRLSEQMAQLPADTWLQLGLGMTKDGSPEKHYEQDVAAGAHDEEIAQLITGLQQLNRPCLLRIGYEFNGHWNGYQAESFVAAWQRIVSRLKQAQLPQPVATVWTYSPEGHDQNYHPYYPGDAWVDWWGIDLFSVEHFSAANSHAFAAEAQQRGFPLMIGESTPRFVGVHAPDAWQRWFAPYIDYIKRFDVRAFSYINWEWSSYPMWSDWGDGRLEAAPEELRQRWLDFLQDPKLVHASGTVPAV